MRLVACSQASRQPIDRRRDAVDRSRDFIALLGNFRIRAGREAFVGKDVDDGRKGRSMVACLWKTERGIVCQPARRRQGRSIERGEKRSEIRKSVALG